MPSKLKRREFPAGYSPADFEYKGTPARDQGDFGPGVGIADMACVNQFGEANNAKFYHGGVVQSSDGTWWLYTEWGRTKPGNSWAGSSWTGNAQDFQFVLCGSEDGARTAFAKKMASKNTKRLTRITVAGKEIWAGKKGKDGYIVQRLATREKGLPDATRIKDNTGIDGKAKAKATPKKATKVARPTRSFDPAVVALAQALVGGTQTYTRSLAAASGVTPSMDSIEQVREDLIPAALQRIKKVGDDIDSQVRDHDLVAISKMVAALVPRPIPRKGQTEAEAILSSGNILVLQQDLDAFEGALLNEDFEVEAPATTVNPDALLNARLRWMDPRGKEGQDLWALFLRMSYNRHSYLGRNNPKVRNLFAVSRPDRDARFMAAVKRVGAQRKGRFNLSANLQFPRQDLEGLSDDYAQANVIFTQHGTRSVNVSPIMGAHFRLPQHLNGVAITGANFGHGVYVSSDFRKAAGYTSTPSSYWSGGSGSISERGAFMFLCDMIMGNAYRAPSTGSWASPPGDHDSVFGVGGDPKARHHLANDEHVAFQPEYIRIRYLVELDF